MTKRQQLAKVRSRIPKTRLKFRHWEIREACRRTAEIRREDLKDFLEGMKDG